MTPTRTKPTVAQLGIDLTALDWQRSGTGAGSFEVAFVGGSTSVLPGAASAGAGAQWVLLRVAGDPVGRVLVYDRIEWESFLDGARRGEFDDAARQADAAATAAGECPSPGERPRTGDPAGHGSAA